VDNWELHGISARHSSHFTTLNPGSLAQPGFRLSQLIIVEVPMRIKHLVLVVTIAIGVGLAAAVSVLKPQARQADTPQAGKATASQGAIQLEVLQLPAVNGVIPAEIIDAKIIDASEVPDRGYTPERPVGGLKFSVRNNTSSAMLGIVIKSRIVSFTSSGKELKGNVHVVTDAAVHPDVIAMHGIRPVGPGETRAYHPDYIEVKDGIAGVKGITLQIDYVDFAGHTQFGPNTFGPNHIPKMREGAARYKAWLVGRYRASGESEAEVETLLRQSEAPKELGFTTDGEASGARLYRRHLHQHYLKHGRSALDHYLKSPAEGGRQ
jgi:hypothetical protein